MALLSRKPYRTPKLPDGLFNLIPVADADDPTAQDSGIGPYEGSRTIEHEDGSVDLVNVGGMPYLLFVSKQEGDVLTLATGERCRIVLYVE